MISIVLEINSYVEESNKRAPVYNNTFSTPKSKKQIAKFLAKKAAMGVALGGITALLNRKKRFYEPQFFYVGGWQGAEI